MLVLASLVKTKLNCEGLLFNTCRKSDASNKPYLEICNPCKTKLVDRSQSLGAPDLETCQDSSQMHHEELAEEKIEITSIN